ncbi:MAG: proline dehydrogenase family protein, partial [Candidatus Omnitrophota bacterium]
MGHDQAKDGGGKWEFPFTEEKLEETVRQLGSEVFSGFDRRKAWSPSAVFFRRIAEDTEYRKAIVQFLIDLHKAKNKKLTTALLRTHLTAAVTPWWVTLPLFTSHVVPQFLNDLTINAVTRRLALRFIAGETLEDVAAKLVAFKKNGIGATVPIIGESATSREEAAEKTEKYIQMAEFFRGMVDAGIIDHVDISVKLTALIESLTAENKDVVKENLRKILRTLKGKNDVAWVDMEQYRYKDLTIQILKEVMEEEEFSRFEGLGFVIQTYLTDTEKDVNDLIAWAKKRFETTGARTPIRLVKGADWEQEVEIAAKEGRAPTVFTDKWQTDETFERLSFRLLQNHQYFRLAFGSHNIRTLTAILAAARLLEVPATEFELGVLIGMGEPIAEPLAQHGYRTFVYMGYGPWLDSIAYLSRRVLENSSQDSFFRLSLSGEYPLETLLLPPREFARVTAAAADGGVQRMTIPLSKWAPGVPLAKFRALRNFEMTSGAKLKIRYRSSDDVDLLFSGLPGVSRYVTVRTGKLHRLSQKVEKGEGEEKEREVWVMAASVGKNQVELLFSADKSALASARDGARRKDASDSGEGQGKWSTDEVTLADPSGIHMRPARALNKVHDRFPTATVQIAPLGPDPKWVGLDSLLALSFIRDSWGNTIQVRAEGPNVEQAIEAVRKALAVNYTDADKAQDDAQDGGQKGWWQDKAKKSEIFAMEESLYRWTEVVPGVEVQLEEVTQGKQPVCLNVKVSGKHGCWLDTYIQFLTKRKWPGSIPHEAKVFRLFFYPSSVFVLDLGRYYLHIGDFSYEDGTAEVKVTRGSQRGKVPDAISEIAKGLTERTLLEKGLLEEGRTLTLRASKEDWVELVPGVPSLSVRLDSVSKDEGQAHLLFRIPKWVPLTWVGGYARNLESRWWPNPRLSQSDEPVERPRDFLPNAALTVNFGELWVQVLRSSPEDQTAEIAVMRGERQGLIPQSIQESVFDGGRKQWDRGILDEFGLQWLILPDEAVTPTALLAPEAEEDVDAQREVAEALVTVFKEHEGARLLTAGSPFSIENLENTKTIFAIDGSLLENEMTLKEFEVILSLLGRAKYGPTIWLVETSPEKKTGSLHYMRNRYPRVQLLPFQNYWH